MVTVELDIYKWKFILESLYMHGVAATVASDRNTKAAKDVELIDQITKEIEAEL